MSKLRTFIDELDPIGKASLIIALGLVALAAIQFYGDIEDVKAERRGCERLDTVREGLYDLQGLVIQSSKNRLEVERDPEVRKVIYEAIRDYGQKRAELLASVEEQGVNKEAGSIHADCDAAYPYPWPLG